MREMTIKTRGRTAKIWIQELTVGGIVTDENGKDTSYATTYKGNNYLERFFKTFSDKTGIDFFKKETSLNIAAA